MELPLVDFKAQLEYLKQQHVTVLSLEDFLDLHRTRRPPIHPSVVITFDDGYASTCERVEQLLQEYDYPATLFLTTDKVINIHDGSDKLTWEWVRGLNKLNIQAHTISHSLLTLLNPTQIRHEIQGCKSLIEDALGREVAHFAYPYGSYTSQIIAEVQAAGFKSGWTVHHGKATAKDSPFRLHRTTVSGFTTLQDFEYIVNTGHATPTEGVISFLRDILYSVPYAHDLIVKRPRWS
jgi:peptidoglycan/xylan/chitin deacetylase (PgdA/CDA1 family)